MLIATVCKSAILPLFSHSELSNHKFIYSHLQMTVDENPGLGPAELGDGGEGGFESDPRPPQGSRGHVHGTSIQGDKSGRRKHPVDLVPTAPAAAGPLL